jgi:hypothetical protein
VPTVERAASFRKGELKIRVPRFVTGETQIKKVPIKAGREVAETGHAANAPPPPLPCRMRPFLLLADIVAKVENRTAPKISRKSIFRLPCRCNTLWRRYEGPWSILGDTTWSLTSPHTKRIGGPRNFRPSTEKDFFNTIGP